MQDGNGGARRSTGTPTSRSERKSDTFRVLHESGTVTCAIPPPLLPLYIILDTCPLTLWKWAVRRPRWAATFFPKPGHLVATFQRAS
jgi:hypothetical protein